MLPNDLSTAKKTGNSLLYGELTTVGLDRALDAQHLRGDDAAVVYDLGMGTGKAIMQCFLQCRQLKRAVGIELCAGRYRVAVEAAIALVRQHPE